MMSGEVVWSGFGNLWTRRPIRIAVSLLLLTNLQDMTTSATRFSHLAPKPWLQWVLLLFLIPWCVYYVPRMARRLASIPIPRPVLALFCGVWICQAVCALAEREVYPFSPVAMYGYPLHPQSHAWACRTGESPDLIVHAADGSLQEVSYFREGDPLFATGALSLDMKSGWILQKFRRRNPSAVEQAAIRQLSPDGHRRLERAPIQVNLRTGQTRYQPVARLKP